MTSPGLGAIEIHGMTRSAFILRGALAAGAAYGTLAAGPFVSRALSQGQSADLQVLGFALGLEELELRFYDQALKSARLAGELKELATAFGKHEETHRDTLKQTLEQLGGKAPPAPNVKVSVRDEGSFLGTAVALEELGVGAYNGAAPSLTLPDVVAAAGTIVQTEARHAAALRFQAKQDPAPDAFDRALTPAQVEAALKRL